MSETGGIVVIQAPAQVFQSFERDRDDGLEELVAFAKADPAINDDCDVFFLSLEVKGDSACFEFENEYWLDTARRLTSTGQNIGLYLRSLDEYGGRFFWHRILEVTVFLFCRRFLNFWMFLWFSVPDFRVLMRCIVGNINGSKRYLRLVFVSMTSFSSAMA